MAATENSEQDARAVRADPRVCTAFTLEGDIRRFKFNPLTAETPFGVAYAVSIGDVLEENDKMRAALETIAEADSSEDSSRLARFALSRAKGAA